MFLVRIVKPKSQNGLWVNQAFNRTLVDFKKEMQLTVADFFFQSFCGAHFEKAGKYGLGLGFVDDVWLVSEEWDIQKMFGKENKKVYTNDTMGLASLVVDIANETAYKVAALGQTGYEKLLQRSHLQLSHQVPRPDRL